MRDPHVVALKYRLDADANVTFENPPAIEYESNSFRLRLEKGVATFEPKEHFPTADSARRIAEDFLRAWEIDFALRLGRVIAFTFQDADVIDRNPTPPGSPLEIEMKTGVLTLTASAISHLTRRSYPEPPKSFRLCPDVETLWHRFEGYANGKEPLLSMAYFCLTVIEAKAGSRKQAAKLYRISKEVLSKLGELTSDRGDAQTARKIKQSSTLTPLSSAESSWINAAVKTIIRRVGEIDLDPKLPEITMNDLPTL